MTGKAIVKTHQEIIAEAERLDQLGRQHWDSYRQGGPHLVGETVFSRRVLHRFPATRISERVSDGRNSRVTETHRIARCIEVELDNATPEYALIEEEYSAEAGEGLELLGAISLMRSEAVLDLLTEGYRMVEEDRIGESLEPFLERMEEREAPDFLELATVEEIERIVGAGDLTPGARMHARADIIAFLEGRLGPSEFISAAIERHECRHEVESILESRGERLCIDKP